MLSSSIKSVKTVGNLRRYRRRFMGTELMDNEEAQEKCRRRCAIANAMRPVSFSLVIASVRIGRAYRPTTNASKGLVYC
jgi:hypothetical protein